MNTPHMQKEPAANRRMMRVAAASDYIGLAESTLNKMRMRGDGPAFIKAGKAVLYDPADCDAWLASRRRLSTSEAS
jgi:hypothetical protein